MTKSTYQLAIEDFIVTGTGNAIINAKAGSGKTTTAINGVSLMKGDVCMLAFNKKIAVELQGRLANMGLPNATAATFHSEGLKAFTKGKGRANVNGGKVYNIVEMFTPSGNEIAKCRMAICKLVSFAKNSGFGLDNCPKINDTEAWAAIIQHQDIDIDADVEIEDIIEIAKETLVLSNRDVKVIDFDDMIYLPLLFKLRFTKYDWLIIDEAQDTNVIRKLMMAELMKESSRLLAIGDPHQAIYGFTGAENDSMNLIKEQFNAIELPLSVCYRCGKNIIKAAQEFVPDIEAFDGNGDGEIISQKYEEFTKIASTLGLSKKDGIICRNNAPLVALAFNLIRQGVGCRIEGKDIGKNLITLTRKWKVSDLATFTLRIHKHFDREMERAKGNKLAMLEDKFETMVILIERCQSLGKHDVASLQRLITDMFSDNDDFNVPNVVTLSSIHKAKGLEFDNCYILGQGQFQPSKYAILPWQQEQERNLMYVGITRAKNKLVHITEVPTRRADNSVIADAE